jgi:hypothetical protein
MITFIDRCSASPILFCFCVDVSHSIRLAAANGLRIVSCGGDGKPKQTKADQQQQRAVMIADICSSVLLLL